jgi:hypothetical protein
MGSDKNEEKSTVGVHTLRIPFPWSQLVFLFKLSLIKKIAISKSFYKVTLLMKSMV